MRLTILPLLMCLVAACAGGGGGPAQIAFGISGASPPDGTVDAPTDNPIVVTFTLPADLTTVSGATVRLEKLDGTPVSSNVVTQSFNPSNVRIEPLFDLAENERYRIIISGSIVSADGEPLAHDYEFCFITTSRTPTVRPDQLVDLGDRLNVPRYLARVERVTNGRYMVFGGYSDPDTVTDTIEVWEPGSSTFRVLGTRMLSPRAEHTVTFLNNGKVLIAGGVAEAGGDPLASTEIFDTLAETITPGPSMNEGRRWHAASRFHGGESVFVSGGFLESGEASDTAEWLDLSQWTYASGTLPSPTAQHLHWLFGFDDVYIGVGNLDAQGAFFDGVEITGRLEGDIRFRAAVQRLTADRIFIVGGDTRSMIIYDLASDFTWGATDFLHERRGAHSLTTRGISGSRFLVAGGFNIAAQGSPALATMEIVDYLPVGQFGLPDAVTYRVTNVVLPVPFAGHIAFNQPDGATVLAGGWGDGVGPHSRRVVLVRDSTSSPSIGCARP